MRNVNVRVKFEMIVGEDKYPTEIVLTVDLNKMLSIEHLEEECTNFVKDLCSNEVAVLDITPVEDGALADLPLKTTEEALISSIEDEYESRARKECR